MAGRKRWRCSSVPKRSSSGPLWRWAIQCAATGAPAPSSSSVMAYRSISGRSRPPYRAGQFSPIQPRRPSSWLKAGSWPESQASHFGSKRPAASASARNRRTSARSADVSCVDRRGGEGEQSVGHALGCHIEPSGCGTLVWVAVAVLHRPDGNAAR